MRDVRPMEGGRAEAGRPVGPLSRSTLRIVRRLLHAYREGWLLEERLVTAARMAAGDARSAGLTAEQLLVGMKAQWAALDEVGDLPGPEARYLRDRLVSLTVLAFYEGESRPGPSLPADGGRARPA